jgi:lipoprotein-releasing system permease protein
LNFPFYVAKRYLFSRKKRNAINIITNISISGIAVSTAALIIILSVYNGFENLIYSLSNFSDADIEIKAAEGKTLNLSDGKIASLSSVEGVDAISYVMEETVLLRHENRQYIATIKGVSDNYANVSGVDSAIINGEFLLKNKNRRFAVIGRGVSYYLGVGTDAVRPISVYVLKRNAKRNMNPADAFKRKLIFPIGIFSIEDEVDSKYMIVPIEFTRELLDYPKDIVTSIELKINEAADFENTQYQLEELLGPEFSVKNRYQQNELFYKVMQSEKWAIYFILTFILIIASFNMVGTLTMLILEKKENIETLTHLGSDKKTINRIFLIQGLLVSISGAFIGLIFGLAVSFAQAKFHLIKLKGSESFLIDAYPVAVEWSNVFVVAATVIIIGFLAAWFPIKTVSGKLVNKI